MMSGIQSRLEEDIQDGQKFVIHKIVNFSLRVDPEQKIRHSIE